MLKRVIDQYRKLFTIPATVTDRQIILRIAIFIVLVFIMGMAIGMTFL
jgi:hypothetical protein